MVRYVNVGPLGRYWRLLLKDHACDLDAWEELNRRHARGHLKCEPPLPADSDRLWLDPPLRPAGSSRTLNPPRIHIRTDDGGLVDASDFKAQLLEDASGAYGVDDNPPRRSSFFNINPPKDFTTLPGPDYAPRFVSRVERAQREQTEAIKAQTEALMRIAEAREKAPSTEPEPQQPLKAVDPKDRAALLQWVRGTIQNEKWPRDRKGLPKALLIAWVKEGRPIPADVKESSFRAALGRCARSPKR